MDGDMDTLGFFNDPEITSQLLNGKSTFLLAVG